MEPLRNNEKNQNIFTSFKESKIVTINKGCEDYSELDYHFYIICFKKHIIIIEQNSIQYLQELFCSNLELNIYFLFNDKNAFEQNLTNKIQSFTIDDLFLTEICSFNEELEFLKALPPQINRIWKVIQHCISGFLIKQSYNKLTKNHLLNFNSKYNQNDSFEFWDENEYIELRTISNTNNSIVTLVYHIRKEEFFALKKYNPEEKEIPKLKEREFNNYANLNFPLLPKIYGRVRGKNHIIIEYINGQTLIDIQKMNLSSRDKITIIIEIILVIYYFHDNNFIYRDLKPNNIMLDQNKTVVIIDFDRMIKFQKEENIDDNNNKNNEFTKDFSSNFVAPEVNEGQSCFESDIYSLGQIICYITNEKIPDENHPVQLECLKDIQKIYESCINEDIFIRPDIYEIFDILFKKYGFLIDKFLFDNVVYIQYFLGRIFCSSESESEITKGIYYYTIAANKNYAKAQFELGVINEVLKNINKAIYYYSLASKQNHYEAQVHLGALYLEGKYVTQDIDKAVYYYELAANHDAGPLFVLGRLYIEGKYVKQDIEKAIHYLTLAADKNFYHAIFYLGELYSEGKYIKQDIEKAIYYFSLAAEQHPEDALFFLGMIYEKSKYSVQDINKAIYYYEFASNLHNSVAQFNLGCLYDNINSHFYDINKAIYYFTLAAKNNVVEAMYNLGVIYERRKEITNAIFYYSLASDKNYSDAQCNLGIIYENQKNINKAIYYYKLSASQNNPNAQYNLGVIYEKGIYVTRDINKAIYYYNLANNNNHSNAQCNLGYLYCSSNLISQNINKSIYYFTLSAEQDNKIAQYNLGTIYEKQNKIDKAIYYYTLSANNHFPEAQYILGTIYEDGIYVIQDINKAIHYYTLATNGNQSDAQYKLGLFYLNGIRINQDIKRGISLLILSAQNRNILSYYTLGVIYHEGKYIKQDICKSIHYYKEASSFNNQYAKNNLGIIYKNGFNNEIEKRIYIAIEYLEEAIHQKNDPVSMYNLAHLYLYEECNNTNIDKSISLLIKSINLQFLPSTNLLLLALIKKYGCCYKTIKEELRKISFNSNMLISILLENIKDKKIFDDFNNEFMSFKAIDFVYDIDKKAVISSSFKKMHLKHSFNTKDISFLFYEGFGIK